MPKFGMTMTEAEIVEWYVEQGQEVSQGDPLLGIETEKTSVDIEAPADGFVCALLFEQGDSAEVGSILTYIAETAEEAAEGGAEEKVAAPADSAEPVAPTAPAGENGAPLSRMRRIIADNMRSSLQNTAQLTHFREVCMDRMVALKESMDGISYNDLLMKAFALAVEKYPKVRNQLVNGLLTVKKETDLGMAVALEDGLIVPAIRGVDKLSLQEIAAERKRVVAAARSGGLNPQDTGSCLATLSSLGAQGIDGFTPILNSPESVILGIGRIIRKPWVKDEAIVPAYVTTFSLTFDHQVLDGKDAADFLAVFADILENPDEITL
ncbi:MAG: dihydrolipoamide acetyltransferase family protein [Oscillospiraceae bacterium]|nr:dihydrolipoamide acetyltransferase family protein [Oscillospiraceae bacterium]